MEIRNLEEDDLEQFCAFVDAMYREYPKAMWFQKEPSMDVLRELFRMKIAEMERGTIVDLVAMDGNSMIGECEIVKIAHHIGYLGILVDKAYRRKGVATTLLEAASALGAELKLKEIRAEVHNSNRIALAFMRKMGFVDFEEPNQMSDLTVLRKML